MIIFLSSLLKYGWILRIVDYFWNVSLNWRNIAFIFIAHMSIVSILSIMITTTKNEDESLLFLSWRTTTMQRPQKYVEIRFLIKNGNYCYVSMICCSQSFHMYWLKYDYHNSYCKFVNSICIYQVCKLISANYFIYWCLNISFLVGTSGGRHEKKLLKDLMVDYDNLERPVVNESHPLLVTFGITLQQIIDVVSNI